MKSNGTNAIRYLPVDNTFPVQSVRIERDDGIVEYRDVPCTERTDPLLYNREMYSLRNILQTDPSILKEVPIPQISPSSESFDEDAFDKMLNEINTDNND